MKEKDIIAKIKVYTYTELNETDKILVEKAIKVALNAYAPYSKFYVGAAVKLSNGEIVTGNNQENAAFPSGTCAERSAIYYAHANYPDATVDAIAIAAHHNGDYVETPISPCGACRQAILEYETLAKKPIRVLLCGRSEVYQIDGIATLLPLCFSEF